MSNCVFRWQSQGYSAHIWQKVEICYRWHALYGRSARRFYSEKRSGADVVVAEGEPGAAIVVAASMLNPAVCAAMEIGAPPFRWRRLSIFIGYSWNTDSEPDLKLVDRPRLA